MQKNCHLHNFFFNNLVPVGLWTSTALPPLISDGTSEDQTSTTAIADTAAMPGHGCDIDGQFYMDGMQVGFNFNLYIRQVE